MTTFKKQFRGYNKAEVERFVEDTRHQQEKLVQELKDSQETIVELKVQLQNLQQRQGLIAEAMIDVRQLSKNLLETSKEKADEETNRMLIEASQRLERAEQTIEKVMYLENAWSNYELSMKQELIRLFNDYLIRIETLDFAQAHQQKAEMLAQLEDVQQDLALSKVIVDFPKDTADKTPYENVIPIYSVK